MDDIETRILEHIQHEASAWYRTTCLDWICRDLKLKKQTARKHLFCLCGKGLITWQEAHGRAWYQPKVKKVIDG